MRPLKIKIVRAADGGSLDMETATGPERVQFLVPRYQAQTPVRLVMDDGSEMNAVIESIHIESSYQGVDASATFHIGGRELWAN